METECSASELLYQRAWHSTFVACSCQASAWLGVDELLTTNAATAAAAAATKRYRQIFQIIIN